MNRKNRMTACMLVFIGLTLVDCTKGNLPGGGQGIRFVTSSRSMTTRTAYSGHVETLSGTTTKGERIDWVQGDEFTVYSNNATHIQNASRHTANYIVQNVTTDGLRSRATVDPSDHNGLQWGTATSDYKFYARYPASESSFSEDGSKIKTTADLPYVQDWFTTLPAGKIDMQYAYMFASRSVAYNASDVELDFYPMFTVFQFTIGLGLNEKVTLSSFELSSDSQPIAGPFKIVCDDFDPGDLTAAVTALEVISSDGPRKISVNLGDVVLDSSNPTLTVTVATLPMDLTDLTITFVGNDSKYSDDDDIGTRRLALNYGDDPTTYGAVANTPILFPGCRKYLLKDFSFPKVMKPEEGEDPYREDIFWDVEGKIEVLEWYE